MAEAGHPACVGPVLRDVAGVPERVDVVWDSYVETVPVISHAGEATATQTAVESVVAVSAGSGSIVETAENAASVLHVPPWAAAASD